MRVSQKGASLISLLIGLAVASSVLTALCMTMMGISRIDRETRKRASVLRTEMRIEQILNKVTEDLDRHRFKLFPMITRSDVPFKNPPSSFDLLPSPGSDSLTYVQLSTEKVLRIRTCTAFLSYRGDACPLAPPFRPSQTASFAAVGLNGFNELTGALSGGAPCPTYSLEETESVLFPRKEGEACDFGLIYPIEELYTFYVSRGKEVRYVSHSGARILTNQPVLSSVNDIRFTLVNDDDSGQVCLEAMFTPASGASAAEVRSCSRLARSDFFSLLFEG